MGGRRPPPRPAVPARRLLLLWAAAAGWAALPGPAPALARDTGRYQGAVEGLAWCDVSSPRLRFTRDHPCCRRPLGDDAATGQVDVRCKREEGEVPLARKQYPGPARGERVGYLDGAGAVVELPGATADAEVCELPMLVTVGDLGEGAANASHIIDRASEANMEDAAEAYFCLTVVPAKRTGHSLVRVDADTVLLFGGLSHAGRVLNDLWRYKVSENRWFSLLSTTGAAIKCCTGKPKWQYYKQNDIRMRLREGDRDDVFVVEMEAAAHSGPRPPGRVAHTATLVEAGGRPHMVVVGGYDTAGGDLNDTWSYDVAANAWSARAPFVGGDHPAGQARNGHAAFGDRDSLVLHGGNLRGDMFRYNLTRDAWSRLS